MFQRKKVNIAMKEIIILGDLNMKRKKILILHYFWSSNDEKKANSYTSPNKG